MTTEYANAVAAVRAMEGDLLRQTDMEQLTAAADGTEIAAMLSSHGRETEANTDSLLAALETEQEAVWEMLQTYAPDDPALRLLLYRNDFHNLKASLKAFVMHTDPAPLFLRPTALDLDTLPGIVAAKQYDKLPDYMQAPAAEAYSILTRTLDGQLSDAVLDTGALQALQDGAAAQKSQLMQEYAQLITACADIKTAYRCSVMHKSEAFLETAICGSPALDKTLLIRAAVKGTEALFSYLEEAGCGDSARALSVSPARFEKWCDDAVTALFDQTRMQAFGVEPLAAYYLAKETEIRNLRILLVCKSCGASQETITERMRTPYE